MTTLSSRRIDGPDDMAALFTRMVELGYSDGLPVIPPTERLVAAMIEHVGLAPEKVIGVVAPEDGMATVEKLAINAVMAGCLPEYFPVVIAAIDAVCDPRFDLLGIQTTTNPVTPVLIINGPIRTKLGIHGGRGCMGPGFRANATIGRAVKLALRNIGACPPGEVAKSIHGMPGRFTFCFAELEEASPWEPFHVEQGYDVRQSTVSVVGGQGTINMWIGFSTPQSICHSIADGMRFYASNGYLRGSGIPVVVMGPGHASLFAKAGWTKKRIKDEIFGLTPIPLSHIPDERQISRPVYEDWSRDRSINVCRKADDIVILVAGGSEPYHLTYIPSFTHPEVVITKTIDEPKET